MKILQKNAMENIFYIKKKIVIENQQAPTIVIDYQKPGTLVGGGSIDKF